MALVLSSTALDLRHVDDASDARSRVHVVKALVDLLEGPVVRDKLIDPAGEANSRRRRGQQADRRSGTDVRGDEQGSLQIVCDEDKIARLSASNRTRKSEKKQQ